MTLLAYLAEGLATLLPRRWRSRHAADEDLYAAAAASGVLQYALCAVLVLSRLIGFLQHSMAGVGASAVARNQEGALAGVQYHIGIVYSTAYLSRPVTLLLVYLMCEGLARFVAALVTREVLGTAPLCAVAWAWQRLRGSGPRRPTRRPAERRLGI